MPTEEGDRGGKGPQFFAVQARTIFLQYMMIAVGIVACGVSITLITVYEFVTSTPGVAHVFIIAFSFAIIILGVDIGMHNWPKGSRQSVIVDLRSARLLEEGRVVKEFVFDKRVRLGMVVNQAFHVPDLKPLYGVEFEREGDVIEVSPRESFQLDDVRRLWPLAMHISRKHGLQPTPRLLSILKAEAKKGGYWEEIYEELTGKAKPLVSAHPSGSGTTEGEDR